MTTLAEIKARAANTNPMPQITALAIGEYCKQLEHDRDCLLTELDKQEQKANHLVLVAALIKQELDDKCEALEQALVREEQLTHLVARINEAINGSAPPIEQAGRVRWLLAQTDMPSGFVRHTYGERDALLRILDLITGPPTLPGQELWPKVKAEIEKALN